MDGLHVLGVRHHGPTTARAVRQALARLKPDCVLIEGPPEADELIPLVADPKLKPPVALMVCLPDQPGQAAFWPFAEWSPEWQALSWAVSNKVAVRFMDLPFAARFPEPEAPEAPGEPAEELEPAPWIHPLQLMAQAAGASDHASWWDGVIEQRCETDGLFEAVLEAMAAARPDPIPADRRESRREAWMRRTIRSAQGAGAARVAAVCGAWHSPALVAGIPPEKDEEILAGATHLKAMSSWAPWSPTRLAASSGYGAGVESPGWYAHLWDWRTRSPRPGYPLPLVSRWIGRAAALLREAGMDASSASVIEAVRLAEALAALRDKNAPDLPELRESIQTVLCGGYPEPMELIRQKLEIGSGFGEVPAEGPAVPLQQDMMLQQERLSLKPADATQELALDLRKPQDREKSRFLYRLGVLGVTWGEVQPENKRAKGSFNEVWSLDWEVEFAARIVEAAAWGNTVQVAATNRLISDANASSELPVMVALLDRSILGVMPEATSHLLLRVDAVAAVAADLGHLMDAVPGLARLSKYGDARESDPAQIFPIVLQLVERIIAGLRPACAGLDEDSDDALSERIAAVHQALKELNQQALRDAWRERLASLVDDEGVSPCTRGRVARLLLEDNQLDPGRLEILARLALSTAAEPADAARWLKGLLKGSGLVLLHQEGLWRALDAWIVAQADEGFTEVLPMVRRAFAEFTPSERREMGARARTIGLPAGAKPEAAQDISIDGPRAARVLPVLAGILGVKHG